MCIYCKQISCLTSQGGKISFGYIYGIGGLGVIAIYALLNAMSMEGVTLGCVASVIGYCILPMVLLSSVSIILSLKWVVLKLFTSTDLDLAEDLLSVQTSSRNKEFWVEIFCVVWHIVN